MRIAFSGTHRAGKSTLVERVADALPRHATVDEPYRLLEEEGYAFSDPPSPEDLEAQLERALVTLEEEDRPDVLFDRCPADVLAYLLAQEGGGALDLDATAERIREAMRTLDLVVLVPVEEEDRIPLAAHEDRALRLAVDERLHHLLLDDPLGLEAEVLTVHGDVPTRVEQVLARIGR